MAYGDVLVHTTGPSYGQNIVRNVGVSSGGGGGGAPDAHAASHEDGGSDELDLTGLSGGFQNPYPLVAGFLEDIEMRDDKTLYFDTAGLVGWKYNTVYPSLEATFPGVKPSHIRLRETVILLSASDGDSFLALSAAAAELASTGSVQIKAGSGQQLAMEVYENSGPTDLEMDIYALLATQVSSTTAAGLRVPHGTAPTSPVDGDMWTTIAGLFVRINGVTVGPLS